MKLHTSDSPKKLYGTMRSADFSQKGNQINIFIVKLDDATFNLNVVSTFVKLTMPGDSYVTGIKNVLKKYMIFLIYFVPSSGSLYYMRFKLDGNNPQIGELLYG